MTAETGPSPAADSEEQSRRVPRWVMVVAALVLVVVVGVIVYGYLARPGWIGVADKTFWDYLELLIVPAALALGVYWLNRRQDERDREADAARERERQAQEARREHEREAEASQREHERQMSEDARKQRELEVANQRAQDDALRAYLNQMSSLLLKYDLHSSTEGISAKDISVEDSTARMVARAQTLSVLPMLDGHRKYSVVLFLAESALISKERHIVWLVGADLSNLEVASRSNLRWNLGGTVLHGTDLSGADLHNVFLRKSTLSNTDLSGADLSNADLTGADLSEANLKDANLTGADLSDAKGIRYKELERHAASLKGATMPEGQTYEDWVKKGRPPLSQRKRSGSQQHKGNE